MPLFAKKCHVVNGNWNDTIVLYNVALPLFQLYLPDTMYFIHCGKLYL